MSIQLTKDSIEAGIAYCRWLHAREFSRWRNEYLREAGLPAESGPVCLNDHGQRVYKSVLEELKANSQGATLLVGEGQRKAVSKYLAALKDRKAFRQAPVRITGVKRASLHMGSITKFVSGGKRILRGLASSATTDRVGDVVEPKGGHWTLPIPLLWAHSHKDPIGWVRTASVRGDGIWIEAEVAEGFARADETWKMVEARLVDSFSIGFQAEDWTPIPGGGKRFTSWTLLEVSIVSIPANPDAKISRGSVHLVRSGGVKLIGPPTGGAVRLRNPARAVSLQPNRPGVRLIKIPR